MVPNPGRAFQRLNPLAAAAALNEFRRQVEADMPNVRWFVFARDDQDGERPMLVAQGETDIGHVAVFRPDGFTPSSSTVGSRSVLVERRPAPAQPQG